MNLDLPTETIAFVEADTVIVDDETIHGGKLISEFSLGRSEYGHFDVAACRLRGSDGLNSVDDEFDDRGVDACARPDVLNGTLNIDIAHDIPRLRRSRNSTLMAGSAANGWQCSQLKQHGVNTAPSTSCPAWFAPVLSR